MSRRHKKHHEEHDEHPSEAWLIALADMMTLLMVTFLMMFALSIVDLKKYEVFSRAFAESVGENLPTLADTPAPAEVQPDKPEVAQPAPQDASDKPVLDRQDLAELKERIEQSLQKAGVGQEVAVALDPRGLVLYVTSGVLFDSGQARLTGRGEHLLRRLSPVFAAVGNDLVVEGHTDSRPISSAQFPSNWELSTSRATAVVRHLLEQDGMQPGRVSAAGYADTRPRAPGDHADALAANRRVDIVVEAPPAAAAPAPPAQAAPAPAPKPEPASDGH